MLRRKANHGKSDGASKPDDYRQHAIVIIGRKLILVKMSLREELMAIADSLY